MCLILPLQIPKCLSPGIVISSHRWLTGNNGALCPSLDVKEGNKNNGGKGRALLEGKVF